MVFHNDDLAAGLSILFSLIMAYPSLKYSPLSNEFMASWIADYVVSGFTSAYMLHFRNMTSAWQRFWFLFWYLFTGGGGVLYLWVFVPRVEEGAAPIVPKYRRATRV